MKPTYLLPATLLLLISGCFVKSKDNTNEKQNGKNMEIYDSTNRDTATFGAGCFWCGEAIFQEIKGVQSVKSGYAGGTKKNPTYEEIISGTTGHAEVTQIIYDPSVTTFKELLEVFWQIHDPTSVNKQGNDTGPQYRSAVFYHNLRQKEEAEFYKNKLNEEHAYPIPVITEISPMTEFYRAEDYHQDYYNNNSDQTYCVYVIRPKLDKFRKAFKSKLK
ncbi:MAG: peptide-methionine (S)-S-oxide reductase MsrA [Bacteroidia bacterium]